MIATKKKKLIVENKKLKQHLNQRKKPLVVLADQRQLLNKLIRGLLLIIIFLRGWLVGAAHKPSETI